MPKPKDWLHFAYEDLRLAQVALAEDPPLIGGALYHSQQCAEKALKAYLRFNNQKPPKTHDVIGLLELCSTYDSRFDRLASDAIDLTPFSCATRYPDDAYVFPDITTATLLIKKSENIYLFVLDLIA